LVSLEDSPGRDRIAALLARLHLSTLGIRSRQEIRDLAMDAFQVLGKEAASAVPALASLLTNPATTGNAAICLSEIGAAATPVLASALTNQDAVVRSRAATALGAIEPKDTNSIPALIARLGDDSVTVRACAAWSLGRIRGQPEVVLPALVAVLNDSNPRARRQALLAIAAFGVDARNLEGTVVKLSADTDADVRLAAKTALARLKDGSER
jgi:HEAT repeat protein